MIDEALFNLNALEGLPKVKMKNKRFIYKSSCSELDDRELVKILKFIKSIDKRNQGIRLPLEFKFGFIRIKNKIDYIILEYILYFLIKERHYLCSVSIKFKDEIITFAAKRSPLNTLRGRNIQELKTNNKKFLKLFESDVQENHYRKIIRAKDHGTDVGSKIATDIQYVLEHLAVEKKCAAGISEVVSELMDNAGEHAGADCLVDIDITSDHTKKNTNDMFQAANIVVFNFSSDLLGNKIAKLCDTEQVLVKPLQKLKKAYDTHKEYWNGDYSESDFFLLSVFQNKVSSRGGNLQTGGTGLTKMIKAMEISSDLYIAFVLSGTRKLMFQHDCLGVDSEGWVGFNNENDFVNYPPATKILRRSKLFFPGTAYNLNFVLVKENENENK